jgi:hypothetical protein
VLQPGGLTLLAFHVGDEIVHVDELWGRHISLDFSLFLPLATRRHSEAAGFEVEETLSEGLMPRSGTSEPAGVRFCPQTELVGTAGPIARWFRDLIMPSALKHFASPSAHAWLYQYHVDCNEPVSS